MTATVDLRPDTVNLDGYAGDTLSLRVTVADSSLVEGGTWLAQVRPDHQAAVAATFDITEQEAGSALLTLDAETTTTLGGGFAGQWDCQVTTGDVVRTLVRGKLALSYDITRVP